MLSVWIVRTLSLLDLGIQINHTFINVFFHYLKYWRYSYFFNHLIFVLHTCPHQCRHLCMHKMTKRGRHGGPTIGGDTEWLKRDQGEGRLAKNVVSTKTCRLNAFNDFDSAAILAVTWQRETDCDWDLFPDLKSHHVHKWTQLRTNMWLLSTQFRLEMNESLWNKRPIKIHAEWEFISSKDLELSFQQD